MKLMGYNSQMETIIDSLRSAAFLLVGFFARARASVLAIVVASAAAVGLAACGGGGGGGGDGPRTGSTAYFHGAARVEGLQYRYEDGGSGETDARGRFAIEQGKTVVFSVGETPLGTVEFSSDAGRDFVTPSRIVDNSDEQAVRVERLLIALDDDSHLDNGIDNGIKIPAAAMTSTTNLLEISELRDSDLEGMRIVDGLTLDIPSKMRAQQALEQTNNCAYSGVFAGDFDGEDTAIVLMPNLNATLTLGLNPELVLTNASPIVSFINGEGEEVAVGETVLAIDLKTPPLTATIPVELDDGAMAMGTIILASYDRIEFRAGGAFGVVRRVAGDPNADYRLAGIDGEGGGAFLADIYDGRNAQISSINSPNAQDILEAERTGVFPTGSDTTLTLQAIGNSASATLALRANPNIFLGAGESDDFGGSWCEL